jgi:hypothetical protein
LSDAAALDGWHGDVCYGHDARQKLEPRGETFRQHVRWHDPDVVPTPTVETNRRVKQRPFLRIMYLLRYIILKLNLVLQVLRLHTHEAVHFFFTRLWCPFYHFIIVQKPLRFVGILIHSHEKSIYRAG